MSETRTISGFFQKDHDRLDALLQAYQTLKLQNFSKAKAAFTEFKSGLERHIRWEEDILFPLWEDKSGMSDGGPTFVMRQEHRRIEGQLQAMDRNITEENTEDAQPEQALFALLSGHNLKEERVLYPAIDQVSTPEELQRHLEKNRGAL